MMFDTMCEYCGGECYDDEMKTAEKCKICFVQECLHKATLRSYQGSSHHRARFMEHCINCNAFREYRFYFPTKTKGHMMTLENWDHDEVDLE